MAINQYLGSVSSPLCVCVCVWNLEIVYSDTSANEWPC